MKRFNWKKILSLVLVLTLVVGTLTWNKKAASAEGETVSHPTKVEIETDEHIKLTKELLNLTVSDDEPTATAQIKLTVNGANATIEQPTTGTTDIIFVMDLSNSMDDDTNGKETDDPAKQRITAAKAAAKSFASGILTDTNKDVVRIGIASFGTKGHENKSLSNSLTEVLDAIEALKVGAGETGQHVGGTNLQGGIQAAENLLADSKAANKIIVILSDGQPTYSYQATAVSADETVLNDGTKEHLLTAFNTTRKGNGSDYTFTAYSLNYSNGYPKDGWYEEGNKTSPVTTDKSKVYPSLTSTHSYSYTSVYEGFEGWYKKNKNDKTGTHVFYHKKNISVSIGNNGLPAISESYLAKNKGITFYSIAYDVADNANAVYVMNNVASKDKYYAATSGATTPTQKPISDVINTITKYVEQSVAAAKGTSLKDVVPSYMTITSVGGDDAADAAISNTGADANGYGNQVNWSLSDLDKNSNESIIINVKIDLNMMAAAYAAAHPDKYKDAQAVKEALTKADNDIWFDMNQLVSLSYKTVEGTPVNNEDISALEGNVPQKQIPAYNYTIKYVDEDGAKVADSVTGAAFAGEKIDFTHCDEYLEDNDNDVKVYDHTKTQITGPTMVNGKFTMPANDVTITVKYFYKEYTVKFFDDVNSTTPISKETYRYGAEITVPADPTKDQDDQYTYTFTGWDPQVAKNSDGKPVCLGNADYYAQFDSVTRYYTVKFVDLEGKDIINPQRLAWGANVTKPANSQVPKKGSSETENFTFSGNWKRLGGGNYSSTCDGDATYEPIYTSSVRKYTVTFYSSESGAETKVEFDKKQYEYKAEVEDPVTEENVPTKAEDNYNTYKFDHWTPAFTPVTSDQEYFAFYTATPKVYTVNFIVEGVDNSKGYGYRQTIDNEPKNVAKDPDSTYTYEFIGWRLQENPETQIETEIDTIATRNVTYVAVFKATYIEYTVQFINWNGQELQKIEKLHYVDDVTVTYTQGTPVKYVDETDSKTYTHTFTGFNNGWDNDDNTMSIKSITFDKDHKAVFQAAFDDVYINYSIAFVAEDGVTPILVSKEEGAEKLAVNQYHYGDTVTLPADDDIPAKADETDANGTVIHTYKFNGWTPDVVAVVADATYKAKYTESTSSYTIIFQDWNGDELSNEELPYGSPVTIPTNYTIQPEDATYTYSFDGWDQTVSRTVVGDATYKAVMKSTFKEYTVIFVDDDENETELAKYEGLHYLDDVVVNYTEEHPTKGPDETFTYAFAGFNNGWDNEDDSMAIKSITFDNLTAKFKATYEPTYINYTVTFVLNNGEDDITGQYHYNDDVTIPQDPKKAPDYDAEHKVNIREYTFAYWYKMVDGKEVQVTPSKKATEDVTYYAKYSSEMCEYDVTFTVNYPQGFVVPKDYFTTKTTTYEYGASVEVPTLVGEITVNGIVYELVASWTPQVDTTCHGPAEYVRSYRIKPDTLYTVTFKFENNTDADFEKQYVYGEEIVVPADPEKASDPTFTYKFREWSPAVATQIKDGKEVAVCLGNETYYALYDPTYIDYEVRFIDDEDNKFAPILVNGKEVNTYHFGADVDQPADPEKDADNYNTYEFAGWVNTAVSGAAVTKSVPDCAGDATYMAVYDPTAIMYTVKFEDEGKPVTNNEYGYDAAIVVPENRTKERDDKFDYTFIGWAVKDENEAVSYSAIDVVIDPLTGENDPVHKVTGSITYTAVYEPSLRVFNVYFVDDNGSDLGKGFAYKVTWGETVKAEELAEATAAGKGAADMRSRDDCQFFFAGWTDVDKTPVGPADTVIKADTTFYASYSRQYKFSFYYHGSDASTYGKTGEVLFAQDSVKEGESYDVIKNGPTLASTPTTKYDFIGWSLEQIAPEVLPDYLEKKAMEDERVNVVTIQSLAGAVTEDVYVNGCIVTLCADTILALGENEDGTTRPIDLYPVFAASPVYYTVIFQDADGTELAKRTDFIYNEPALDLKPADPKGSTVVSGYTTTVTTFKEWDVSDEELAAVTKDMIVKAKYNVRSWTELPPITGTPTPTPSTTPTPTPTATPTPTEVPTGTPTPTPEEEEIETPDTPQGPVEEPEEEDIVVPTPETPQGAPEEEVDLDEPETPQGDLPKTGTTPTGVFFGIGAACIVLGSVVLKLRRREEEM